MQQARTLETPVTADASRLRYHMTTRWLLVGTAEEVYAILRRPAELPRWWPAVFLSTTVLRRGDENETGSRVSVHSKGWQPYTVHFEFEVVEVLPPTRITIQVWGDFEGVCQLDIKPTRDQVEMVFDWQCKVNRPLLRWGARVSHKMGVSNHRWTMRQGCKSLQLELNRRQALDGRQPVRPPGPVFPHDRFTQSALAVFRG